MDPVALEKAFEMYPEVKLVVFAHLEGSIIGTNGKIYQPHDGNNCSLNDRIRIESTNDTSLAVA